MIEISYILIIFSFLLVLAPTLPLANKLWGGHWEEGKKTQGGE